MKRMFFYKFFTYKVSPILLLTQLIGMRLVDLKSVTRPITPSVPLPLLITFYRGVVTILSFRLVCTATNKMVKYGFAQKYCD